MTVSNRMVIISIAIVLLEIFQPISAIDDKIFIDELNRLSEKHGYSQRITDNRNDQYTIKFTFNRINHPKVDILPRDDKTGLIFYGRGT